jgi:hypothetical protein
MAGSIVQLPNSFRLRLIDSLPPTKPDQLEDIVLDFSGDILPLVR